MADIRFDTGVQSFQINGGVSVEFNPTDSEFAKSCFRCSKSWNPGSMNTQNAPKTRRTRKNSRFGRSVRRGDSRKIDGIFGKPICTEVFRTNVMALANGLPVWANLMLAVIDEMDAGFDLEKPD